MCFLFSACGKQAPRPPFQRKSQSRKLHRLAHTIYKSYAEHHVAEVIPLYLHAAEEAAVLGDYEFSAKFLINAGACQLTTFRYQEALSTMERARKEAERTGDPDFISTANSNIAALYLEMGNLNSAEAAGERALATLRDGHPQYARVLIPVAQIRAERGSAETAEPLIRQAIEGAYRNADADTAAWAWDYLGFLYYNERKLAQADLALTESLRLRKMFRLSDLGSSYYHLAVIRSEQGETRAAAALFASAIAELHTPGNVTPAWKVYLERGKLQTKSNNHEAAWLDLRHAVSLARDWRAEVVANDANRTSAEAALSELYSLYIDVGNQRPAANEEEKARETFQAAEENRAASLRALAERETGWHKKLPAGYWDMLAALQTAEQNLFLSGTAENRAEVNRVRALLDDMEADSGAPHGFAIEPAATATQKKLGPDAVLLSFQLGNNVSWLWAVSKTDIAVYRLPARRELTGRIQEFQACVRRGSPDADRLGAELYQSLFGALPPRFSQPERWIFSLDQDLFALPLPALVVRFDKGQPVYLGAEHALEATPGALMYAAAKPPVNFDGHLLALGDAIYNRADPRFEAETLAAGFPRLDRSAHGDPLHFARLWGTAGEIRTVARAWNREDDTLLTGPEVSRERLWNEVAKKPAIIHFATHILEANDQLHTGWIALSLSPAGHSEFLSPAEISARKLNTSLVVLNGCSSGSGEVRAASGLLGLTRAWIAAGAGAVLATRWPGPDDSGDFFRHFYESLRKAPGKGAAFALRAACRSSIEGGGWRAKPQFWASYFLTGID